MKIRILGGGWYGCHIASVLHARGCEVELHEAAKDIFSGASGANPARLHLGFHYPRSKLTRAACQEHYSKFMEQYGFMTRVVPVNLYAVAAEESQLDFGTYLQVLRGDCQFIEVQDPEEFGLQNVEGAIMTGERHIVIDEARAYFKKKLGKVIQLQHPSAENVGVFYDWTIDCTFCAHDALNIDRFEPCVTALLSGPTNRAVTVMDGPFPSLYPWNEKLELSSLTSAKFTPFSKSCYTYRAAQELIKSLRKSDVRSRCKEMIMQLAKYWPESRDLYRFEDAKLSIRAMPKSGADARLVDIQQVEEKRLRVRAGKIDAILHAGRVIVDMIHA